MIRLNKFLAHAGIASRRQCDEMILAGRVTVDGVKVRELGVKVELDQKVCVDGNPLEAEKHVYWLVHKPRGYLCTNRDPAKRPLAIDLVPPIPQRVYTVGRLDEDSEGLVLLTNDGELANQLTHPRFGVEKTYHVQVAGRPTEEDLQKLKDGMWISDGRVRAHRVRRIKKQGASTWLRIVLCEGKNREIRRMLAHLEHKVMRLHRVGIGPLQIGTLRKGKARKLTPMEVESLKKLAGEKPDEHKSKNQSRKRRAKNASKRPTS